MAYVTSNKFSIRVNKTEVAQTSLNTQVIIYKGTNQLSAVSGTPGTNEYKVSITGTTNCSARLENDHKTITLTSVSSNNGQINISINVENAKTYTKTISVANITATSAIKNVSSRVQTVEQKLTKDGITNIVGDYYADGTTTRDALTRIEQKADSVTTTVSNMQISSRNLLKNTDFKQGKSYWNSDIDIKTSTNDLTPGGNYSALVESRGNTSNTWKGISQEIITVPNSKLKNNTDYMLSFYIWFNADNPIDDQFGIEIKAIKSDGTHSTVQSHTYSVGDSRLETGSWLRFTVPFNFNTTTTNHFVYIWTKKNGTFRIGDMMLTEGNKYVPWINASEDNREYAESKITQTASEVRYEFQQGGGFPNLLYNSSPGYNNDTGWGYWQASKYTGDTNYSELGFYIPDGYNEGCLTSPEVSVTGGKTYSFTISMFVEQNCTYPQVGLRIRYTDGSLAYPVGVSESTIVKWNGSNSKWWRYTFSYTMPDNADYVRLEFGQGARGANSGYVIRIRNVMIIEGEGIYPNRWYPNSNEIQSNTTTIDINGVNVRHSDGARTNLNATALNFYNSSNNLYAQVQGGMYKFWNGSQYIGYMGHTAWADTNDQERVIVLASEYGCSTSLSSRTSSTSKYQTWVATFGKDTQVNDTTFHKGCTLTSPHLSGVFKLYGTSAMTDAYPAQIYHATDGQLALFGDNKVAIGVMNGTELRTGIMITEDGNANNKNHMDFYGSVNMNGYSITNGNIAKSVNATSAQTYALRTMLDEESYSDPNVKAITDIFPSQTPTEGEIRWSDRQTYFTSEWEEGVYEAYIEIPWWIAQNLELDYHVSITCTNGFFQYYVSERDPYYFIVRSDKDSMGFTFEIVGKLLDNNTTAKNASIASDQYGTSASEAPDIIPEFDIIDIKPPVGENPTYTYENDIQDESNR